MADFVLEGPKWGSAAPGKAGGTVTWAIDATIPTSFLPDIRLAFADWADHANIQFQEVASTVSSQSTSAWERLTASIMLLHRRTTSTPVNNSPPHLSN